MVSCFAGNLKAGLVPAFSMIHTIRRLLLHLTQPSVEHESHPPQHDRIEP